MSTTVIDRATGRDWAMFNADSCEAIRGIPDASVGLTIHSPPFSTLYIYSSSIADMGNSADHEEFFSHYDYLIPELRRVTRPGRLCCVHCKDLPLYKNRDGAMGLYDFPGDVVRHFIAGGWAFHSRLTIWKDPVTEMQRTKNHGLLYKNLMADSCGSRQGMADYLLVFRNWGGEFTDPVTVGGERFDSYIGMDPPDPTDIAEEHRLFPPTPDPKTGRWPRRNPFPAGSEAYRQWSIRVWQKYASPVWFDIDQTNVIQARTARAEADERHLCPLQLDVIERCVALWSNPGDVVFDPFGGIGSTLLGAVRHGRKGLGVELKPSYYQSACKELRQFEAERDKPTLFDVPAMEEVAGG